ncbi:MAG: protoheme IX farnesyltransferase [Chloroflexota bacterium]
MHDEQIVQVTTISRPRSLWTTVRLYWPLIKILQTLLLLITGIGGYMSAYDPVLHWTRILSLSASLFLAISGSTMLNMVLDRDIDALMKRTQSRPLPAGKLDSTQVTVVSVTLSTIGVLWGFILSPLFGAVITAGLIFDVMVYSLWLKRRTAWAVIWGGISGGMPVLAGRVLGTGQFDLVGMLLALAIVTWIPSHIIPLTLRYREDYARAGIPTVPARYGEKVTRIIVSLSITVTAVMMLLAAYQSGMSQQFLIMIAGLGAALLLAAVVNALFKTRLLNLILFKSASLYMLGTMAFMIVG